jgi:ABC-2 type transport system ATP-binding protein
VLLQLDTTDLLGSLKALEGEAGVREVAVFGRGLHVTVDDAEAGVRAVRAAVERQGIGIERLEQIYPAMEDVFVALIEAEERKAA